VVYTGFSAQNEQSVIPETIGQDDRGYLTLSDLPIHAAPVNAVKEIESQNQALKSQLDEMSSLRSDVAELKALMHDMSAQGSK